MPSQGGPVTSVRDPLPLGQPGPGCRLVGIGLRLRGGGSAASVDLFSRTVVATSGAAYQAYTRSVEGRDGVHSTDLVPGDERRGTVVFQVPATQGLRYFAVGALVTDLAAPGEPVSLPPYRPGGLARAGHAVAGDGRQGWRPARAYSVQLRLRAADGVPGQ